MTKWIFALIQFFPLSLFATYAFYHGVPTNDRWLDAFQLASIAGLIQLAIILPQRRAANRLVLAGNLYLILGGLASITHQWWYFTIYDALRESAIFIFMAAVGVFTTFFSSAGFVVAPGAAPYRVRHASYALLAATLVALAVSIVFQGNRNLAAVVPIIGLAILQRVLAFHAQRTPQPMAN